MVERLDLEHPMKVLDFVEARVFVLAPDERGRPVYRAANTYSVKQAGKSILDFIGKTAEEVFPGERGKLLYRHHRTACETGQAQFYEEDLSMPEGERRFRSALRPVLDDDNRVRFVVGTTRDVTLEASIDALRKRLDVRQREMEAFVSIAAHDLRTPMRQVQSIAQLLQEEFQDLGDGKKELLEALERLSAKAQTLISDILAHAEAVSAGIDSCEFELSPLVRDIVDVLDPMGSAVVTCTTARIRTDRPVTQVCLQNLIDNALKHARRDDSVPLRLEVSVARAGSSRVDISVRDNGAGFDDAAVAFADGGRFRTESGFGLLGVRSLVRVRGGAMRAANHPAGGAVLTISLPGDVLEFEESVRTSARI